jgi:uncharacterized protein YbaP (TraB family)
MWQILKRPGIFLLFSLVAVPYLSSQPAGSPPKTASKKAIFWKATSPTSTVWLLGSIHLGSKDMYPLPKEIEDAFAASSALMVEADIRHMDMSKAQATVMAKGLYPAGDNLWNHVTPETRQKVEKFAAQFGLPLQNVLTLKPWVVALTMSTLPLVKAGLDPKLGIDMYFLEKAGQKRIVEIESTDWQIDLLSGFSDDLQEKFLAAAAEEGLDMTANLKRLQAAWSSGDADALDAITQESTHTPEQITRALLQDRNPHMADAAVEYLKGKETAFLVVGAAHMVGKDGIVSLLKKRGYQVEQVALKN